MATEAELEEVRRLFIDEGISQGEIAKRVGHSKSTVHRWLAKMDVLDGNTERSRTKKAVEYHKNYSRERLIELNNLWLEKAEKFIHEVQTPQDMRTLVNVYGVGVDKRLLLEPIVSNTNGKSGLEEIRESLRGESI